MNRDAAQCGYIDAERGEVMEGFAAEEFAADFMMRTWFFLDQTDGTSGQGECGCERRTGEASPDHKRVRPRSPAQARSPLPGASSLI